MPGWPAAGSASCAPRPTRSILLQLLRPPQRPRRWSPSNCASIAVASPLPGFLLCGVSVSSQGSDRCAGLARRFLYHYFLYFSRADRARSGLESGFPAPPHEAPIRRRANPADAAAHPGGLGHPRTVVVDTGLSKALHGATGKRRPQALALPRKWAVISPRKRSFILSKVTDTVRPSVRQ